MFETIRTLIYAGCLLSIVFIAAVSLPQSRLREFLLPIVGWGFALFCGAYVLMPVDLVPELIAGPFGLIDDAGAAVAGIMAARAALRSGR